MATLLISDLHLGIRSRHDVLRRPEPLQALLDALEGIERLVLLGDVWQLSGHHPRRTAAIAGPVLQALGRRLGADGEVVVVPGNHDAALIAGWARAQGRALAPATRVDPRASRALERLVAWLAPARVRVSYPGVWLGDGVWATHGHYLNHHLIPESAAGLARLELLRRAAPPALPVDYEPRRQGAGRGGAGRGARIPGLREVPRLMLRAGLAPVSARLLDAQMRHISSRAMARVARRLGIDAGWVLFGHVHRRGPIAAERWPVHDGVRLLNTGSWLYDPLLVDRATPPHPYWPGGAVLLADGAAPRSVGLLDHLGPEQLRARRARAQRRIR